MGDFQRFAGLAEHRCIARDALGLYGSIVVVGAYTIAAQQPNDSLPREGVIRAVKHCINEYQALSTIIQVDPKQKRPRLLRAPSLDLRHHIRFLDDERPDKIDDVEALLLLAHNERHDHPEKTPQWRVYIAKTPVNDFLVAFACSHSLADGRSAMNFHRTFLTGLQTVNKLTYDDTPKHTPSDLQKLPPSMEESGNLTISWPFLLEAILGDKLPLFLTKLFKFRPSPNESFYRGATTRPPRPPANSLITTSLHHTAIPQPLLATLLTKCKAHDTRLTSLINHLTAKSLSKTLSHHSQSEYTAFRVTTPIDLRSALGLPLSIFGCYASAVVEDIHLPPSSSAHQPLNWSDLATSTRNLSAKANTLADQLVALLRYLSDMTKLSLDQTVKMASVSFETSNLGVFAPDASLADGDETRTGKIMVEDLVFSQSADLTGAPLCVNVASVRGGGLNVVWSWVPGMLGVEEEERFVRDVGKNLIEELEKVASSS